MLTFTITSHDYRFILSSYNIIPSYVCQVITIVYQVTVSSICSVAEKTHASKTKKGTEGTVCNSATEIFVTF